MHPFTPYITEEIWGYLDVKDEEFIINSKMTDFNGELINKKIEKDMNIIMSSISAIRNIKASLNIHPSKTMNLHIRGPEADTSIIEKNINLLNRLAKIDHIEAGINIKKPNQSATAIIKNIELFVPLKGLIDLNQEIARLEKQIEDMNGRLNTINRKLENKNFIDRAPKDVVSHEKNKKADYELQLKKIEDNFNALKD